MNMKSWRFVFLGIVFVACLLMMQGCITPGLGLVVHIKENKQEKRDIKEARADAEKSLEVMERNPFAYPYNIKSLKRNMDIAQIHLDDLGVTPLYLERLRARYEIAYAKHWNELYLNSSYLFVWYAEEEFQGSFKLSKLDTPFTEEE